MVSKVDMDIPLLLRAASLRAEGAYLFPESTSGGSGSYEPAEACGVVAPSCRIDRVITFIINNFRREISLKEVAEVACLSVPAFCVFYRNETGETFITGLNRIRTGAACKLLRTTELSVLDIAYEAGYSSPANFHRQFRKHMELSPLAYRQACRQHRIGKQVFK